MTFSACVEKSRQHVFPLLQHCSGYRSPQTGSDGDRLHVVHKQDKKGPFLALSMGCIEIMLSK